MSARKSFAIGSEQLTIELCREYLAVSYTHLDVYKRQEQHRPDYTPYIIERDGLYYSLRHHSAIYGESLEEAREAIAQLWHTAHRLSLIHISRLMRKVNIRD